MARILLYHVYRPFPALASAQGNHVMTSHLRFQFLVLTALVGLTLPYGEAHRLTTPLTQTPVTGQLADGSAFRGWLTIHDVTVDAQGQLTASGLLTCTAIPALGTAIPVPPRSFTTLAAVLDLRASCTTLVVDLGPIFLSSLAQEVTLVPVIVSERATPNAEHLAYTAL